MSAFEVLFSFYGLLLGLAVASITGGLGDLWRRRARRPVGVLIPLLSLYILLAATQQWMSFWRAREAIAMTPDNLLMCLAMALPYVFVAHAAFPEGDDPVATADTHYLAQARTLLAVLTVPPVASLAYNVAAASELTRSDVYAILLGRGVPLSVIAALIAVPARRWQLVGLVLLSAERLVAILG